MKALYVTSLEGGAGKTAVAAALASLLAGKGKRAGYFKPVALVGGEDWTGDADTSFCRQALGLDDPVPLAPRAETPGALRDGLGPDLRREISQRWAKVAQGKDAVFVEGLPAAGPAAAASRELAELTEARVLAVVRFRRGMDPAGVASLRDLFGDRLLGVLLNAVPFHSRRAAQEELAPALREKGVSVVGVVPEDRLLVGFTVGDYSKRLGGRIMNDEEKAAEIVEHILVGAMVVDSSEHYYERKQNKVLVTRCDRPDLQWNALEGTTKAVILTGGGEPIAYVREKAEGNGVPLVLVEKSTLDTLAAIESFVTSPTFHHPRKLARYAELLRQHADLSALLS